MALMPLSAVSFFPCAEGIFIKLPARKPIVGAAASRAERAVRTAGAFPREHAFVEAAVIGKRIRIVPDIGEGSGAEIAFVESLVVHGFAAPNVSDAVDPDGRQACPAAFEDCFAAFVAAKVSF